VRVAIFAVASLMTVVALALVVTQLLWAKFKSERRLSELRFELKALEEANAAGGLDPAQRATRGVRRLPVDQRTTTFAASREHFGGRHVH
jgi:hypothetical protein